MNIVSEKYVNGTIEPLVVLSIDNSQFLDHCETHIIDTKWPVDQDVTDAYLSNGIKEMMCSVKRKYKKSITVNFDLKELRLPLHYWEYLYVFSNSNGGTIVWHTNKFACNPRFHTSAVDCMFPYRYFLTEQVKGTLSSERKQYPLKNKYYCAFTNALRDCDSVEVDIEITLKKVLLDVFKKEAVADDQLDHVLEGFNSLQEIMRALKN